MENKNNIKFIIYIDCEVNADRIDVEDMKTVAAIENSIQEKAEDILDYYLTGKQNKPAVKIVEIIFDEDTILDDGGEL